MFLPFVINVAWNYFTAQFPTTISILGSGSEGDDVLTIGLNRAVDLIANNPKKKTTAKALGESEGKSVTVQSGRYGPYVQLGKVRATLPKDETEDSITLERALELIAAKAAKGAPKKKARRKTSAN